MQFAAAPPGTSHRQNPIARKLARVVQPTKTERFFSKNDIIVSKTDLKGRLTYMSDIHTSSQQVMSAAEELGQCSKNQLAELRRQMAVFLQELHGASAKAS